MAIDIFSIEPSVVTRNLSGKSFFFYGACKTGKTSNAVKFPKPLVLGFEKGWNMIGGVKGQTINKWKEALEAKKQLLGDAEKVAAKLDADPNCGAETFYKTVIMDTATIAYNLCEEYVLIKEGVDSLDETENSRGYKKVEKEFDKFCQEIAKAGYTFIAIAHEETKQIKKNGVKYDVTQPKIDKRGTGVLAGLCDIVGYACNITNEDGITSTQLIMRGNEELVAGTRHKYTSERIPFTYEALLQDMNQAIDKQKAEGVSVTDAPTAVYKDVTPKVDYATVVADIGRYAKALIKSGKQDDYTTLTNQHIGKNKLVRDTTPDQVDILDVLLSDLKDLCTKEQIEVAA